MENTVLRKGLIQMQKKKTSKPKLFCNTLFTLEEQQSEEDSILLWAVQGYKKVCVESETLEGTSGDLVAQSPIWIHLDFQIAIQYPTPCYLPKSLRGHWGDTPLPYETLSVTTYMFWHMCWWGGLHVKVPQAAPLG